MKLAELQGAVFRFITEPGGIPEALAAAGGESLPEQLVRPSASLQPLERLLIYRRMYLLRMEEALAADYPLLQAFLGERAFFELVARYVERYPSRSWTLDRLGDQLYRFVAEDPLSARWRRLLLDIVRVEKAMVDVNEAAEDTSLSPHSLAKVEAEDWGQLRLQPIAALRLLQLRYPVQRLLAAWREQQPLPKLRPRLAYLLIWRQNYTVWRRPLEPRVGRLLQALLRGDSLEQALAGAGRFSSARLYQTFQMFMQDGLFAQARLAPL